MEEEGEGERIFKCKKSNTRISLKKKIRFSYKVVGEGWGVVLAFSTFLAAGWGPLWLGWEELPQSGSN